MSFCTNAGVPVLDPSNLNMPSIATGSMAGTQTVTRSGTNASGQKATFTAASSGLAGMTVAVSPASFTLNARQSQTLTVTIAIGSAALNVSVSGALVWTRDKGHVVRIPTVVRPVAMAAPTTVSGTGSASFSVKFGYTGAFTAALRGLVPASITSSITSSIVTQDPDQTFDAGSTAGTVAIQVTISAGTTHARFAVFDADVAAGSDIDLYVCDSSGVEVGASGSSTSAEEVNLANPAAGVYTVYAHGRGLPSGSSPFKLNTWLLGTVNAGNATLTAPTVATAGVTATITVTPAAALAAGRYLGSVVYRGASSLPAPTLVRIDK